MPSVHKVASAPNLKSSQHAQSDHVYDGGNYEDPDCDHQDFGEVETRKITMRPLAKVAKMFGVPFPTQSV
jgi:hypothetical protein